jgi:hypothetical protein
MTWALRCYVTLQGSLEPVTRNAARNTMAEHKSVPCSRKRPQHKHRTFNVEDSAMSCWGLLLGCCPEFGLRNWTV